MWKTTMFILRHWKTPKEGNKVPAPVELTSSQGRQRISSQLNKSYGGDKARPNNSQERPASQAYIPVQAMQARMLIIASHL